MNDFKQMLVGHVKDQCNEALLRKWQRDHRVQTSDRSFGSYVLVNVPSKKESHQNIQQDIAPASNPNQTRNL